MPKWSRTKKLYRRFCEAAEARDRETVLHLIRHFPYLGSYEGDAGSLVNVINMYAPELLQPAFESGLSPDAGSDHQFQTLLQKAAAEADLETLRLAIRHGADLEKRSESGEVALGYACSWGHMEAVRVLVEAGANVNAIEQDPESGYRNTPLDCSHEYPEIAEYLRSKGAKFLSELES